MKLSNLADAYALSLETVQTIILEDNSEFIVIEV